MAKKTIKAQKKLQLPKEFAVSLSKTKLKLSLGSLNYAFSVALFFFYFHSIYLEKEIKAYCLNLFLGNKETKTYSTNLGKYQPLFYYKGFGVASFHFTFFIFF